MIGLLEPRSEQRDLFLTANFRSSLSLHFGSANCKRPLRSVEAAARFPGPRVDAWGCRFPPATPMATSIVFFPKSHVVHMGDVSVTHFPFVDIEAGGSLDAMIDAVKKVIAQVPADVKVIPGHGQLSSLEDLRAYLSMLEGDARRGGARTEGRQNARADETGEDSRSMEEGEVRRRIRQRGCVPADSLHLADRTEDRRVYQAQLICNVISCADGIYAFGTPESSLEQSSAYKLRDANAKRTVVLS